MSHDLLSYKEARIEALLNRIEELELKNEKITKYVFELCDKDCPEDYKRVVKGDVFQQS